MLHQDPNRWPCPVSLSCSLHLRLSPLQLGYLFRVCSCHCRFPQAAIPDGLQASPKTGFATVAHCPQAGMSRSWHPYAVFWRPGPNWTFLYCWGWAALSVSPTLSLQALLKDPAHPEVTFSGFSSLVPPAAGTSPPPHHSSTFFTHWPVFSPERAEVVPGTMQGDVSRA